MRGRRPIPVRSLEPDCLRVGGYLSAAYQRGKEARLKGTPISQHGQHPMSHGMIAAFERGWIKQDEELRKEGTPI